LKGLIYLIILALLLSGGIILPASANNWQAKVDMALLEETNQEPSEFLVYLQVQADLDQAKGLITKSEKGSFVYERLNEIAGRNQAPILRLLEQRGVAYQAYWVVNMIWVRGDAELVQLLAERSDVSFIYANPWVKMDLAESKIATSQSTLLAMTGEQRLHPVEIATSLASSYPSYIGTSLGARLLTTTQSPPWNITQIHAPEVWAMGYTGQGVVIGGQDTGYDWTHPALKRQYRGWNGNTADHNYNWYDAIHSGSSSCGINSPVPCDDYGHGTHTMGTMVGDDGNGNQVGVAPGAHWIGCRNMRNGYGSPASYTECYQWFIAPTNLQGHEPRPELAPDVINNSWSCPTSEGCSDPAVLQQVVENVRAAGILTVHSAGNAGPSCSTVRDPATIYDASFSIGATEIDPDTKVEQIAGFSSRGPVTSDGSNRLKPNVSAPGVNILSSLRGGGYGLMNGTSMAAPHVAGLVALVISAYPERAGEVSAMENLIEQTALPMQTSDDCGGTAGKIPNNTYGWGRIDALEAVQGHWLDIDMTVDPVIALPNDILTYTITITHTHPISPTFNVVVTDTLPTHTTFLDSATPYIMNGDILQWERTSMDAKDSWTIHFRVQIDVDAPKWIINELYGVNSSESPQVILGYPTSTKAPLIFFPYLGMDVYRP
jgi:serine protease AprX